MLDQSDEMKEEYERLTHPPAEAQIDFGITEAIEDGKAKDIHALVMSFIVTQDLQFLCLQKIRNAF